MTTAAQIARNARRAFERLAPMRDMRAALHKSGQLLGKYTRALPDTAEGLRARQSIVRAADAWLDKCERGTTQ